MERVHLDFETRSTTDLIKCGVYRYVEDPNTGAWGFRYQFDGDETIYEWRPGDRDPERLLAAVSNGGILVAHNAIFERLIWNYVIRRQRPHWPILQIEQMDCTQARAAALAFPLSLDNLGKALRLKEQKDMEGSAIMKKMAKPRGFDINGSPIWWDSRDLIDRNMAYCGQDIRTEAEADQILLPLTAHLKRLYVLDQKINERGVPFDMPLVNRCEELVAYTKKRNDSLIRHLSGRSVPKCTNDGKIIAWLNKRDIPCSSIAKEYIDQVIYAAEQKQDTTARQVLELRQASKKTSTAKYTAIKKCVSADGRARKLLEFHGASTGRWAGRLIQPQNLPRVPEEEEYRLSRLIKILEQTDLDIEEIYERMVILFGSLDIMTLLSAAVRLMIKAQPGNKLIGGDFSNVEGRVNAWLAGEHWKLQAFRNYDAGTGPDLYKLAYSRSFGADIDAVTSKDRQVGKVQELALGFQGATGAVVSMCEKGRINPFNLADAVISSTDSATYDHALGLYHAKGQKTFGLSEKVWAAFHILVRGWRKSNPAIKASWKDYQDAAVQAVHSPGELVPAAHGKVGYYCEGSSLWGMLPSGRMLHYDSPYLAEEKVEYVDEETAELREIKSRQVRFWGESSQAGGPRKWKVQALYGGLQCENFVQATACDLMVDAMFRAEDAGYPIILTVHDEILSEVPATDARYSAIGLEALMSQKDDIYADLPLAVAAWEEERYSK